MVYNGDLCVAASIVSYCPRKNWKVTEPQHLVLRLLAIPVGLTSIILYYSFQPTEHQALIIGFYRVLPLSFLYALASVCHNPFKVDVASLEVSIALWGETEESKHVSRLLPRHHGQSPSLSSIHSNDICLTRHLSNRRMIRLRGKHGRIYFIL